MLKYKMCKVLLSKHTYSRVNKVWSHRASSASKEFVQFCHELNVASMMQAITELWATWCCGGLSLTEKYTTEEPNSCSHLACPVTSSSILCLRHIKFTQTWWDNQAHEISLQRHVITFSKGGEETYNYFNSTNTDSISKMLTIT